MLYQCSDDTSKSEQTLIDVSGLTSPFVDCTRPTDAFAASQVHLQHVSQSLQQHTVKLFIYCFYFSLEKLESELFIDKSKLQGLSSKVNK